MHDKDHGLHARRRLASGSRRLRPKLRFGLGEHRPRKERGDISNDWTNGSGQYGTLYQTAGCPVQCNPYSFGSQGFNVISMIDAAELHAGRRRLLSRRCCRSSMPRSSSRFLKSLNGKPNPFYCTSLRLQPHTLFDFADTVPQPNPFNSYAVTEKTISGYVEADFVASRWSGNLGVRVVHTETTADDRLGGAGVAVDRRSNASGDGDLQRAVRHLAADRREGPTTPWRCRR